MSKTEINLTPLNQIFHDTRCITSCRGHLRVIAPRQNKEISKKCCSGGEPLATLCPI